MSPGWTWKDLARPEGFEPPTYGSGGPYSYSPVTSTVVCQASKIGRSCRFRFPRKSAKIRHCLLRWLQFGCSDRFEERVEFADSLATYQGQHMAVGIERHGDLGVAPPFSGSSARG